MYRTSRTAIRSSSLYAIRFETEYIYIYNILQTISITGFVTPAKKALQCICGIHVNFYNVRHLRVTRCLLLRVACFKHFTVQVCRRTFFHGRPVFCTSCFIHCIVETMHRCGVTWLQGFSIAQLVFLCGGFVIWVLELVSAL